MRTTAQNLAGERPDITGKWSHLAKTEPRLTESGFSKSQNFGHIFGGACVALRYRLAPNGCICRAR